MVGRKEVQMPPSAKRIKRQKPTMSEHSRNSYRLGRRTGEQGPHLLLSNQERNEKLTTGEQAETSGEYEEFETSQKCADGWNVERGTSRHYGQLEN